MLNVHLNRRHLLASLGVTAAFGGFIPRLARAAGARDPRLVVIVLRGAMDGLDAVPPVGDPDFAALRGGFPQDGLIKLDSTFSLHPSLVNFSRQFQAGQGLVIHAVASPYRDRSHFDGQDVLESGMTSPGHTESGWLNRALSALPNGQTAQSGSLARGLGVGGSTPLIMRGPAPALGWAPSSLKAADADLPPRLMALYDESDPQLAQTLKEAIDTGKIIGGNNVAGAYGGPGDPKTMAAMAQGAAKLLAQPDGPRLAGLAFEGWDTHAAEPQRLARQLQGLDDSLAAFESTLGPVWNDTAVLVVTEFGRTAAVNGTNGTDHGTATVALLTGGALKGGRVISDWPGLKPAQLYQNRDLAPTTDLRSVAKGLLAGLYDMPDSAMSQSVFPDSAGAKPMRDLIA
ncbi:DUF1501 domain-containing protein [Asticcacaulis sp. EMRT-3]|uniref:DUF1501 domain-containing protein n=1 Tax=Asticcacaulis sp. EMRT-3 TaxID=3040349 RepID=UPI0024AEDBC6|nr:DUF1501 domain-containing protein [Asticcacaulis sp. EMRT-3]MDI7773933.1 DUF1501 domain-containing protein [Asticcacaulis sp. EMRT-3]